MKSLKIILPLIIIGTFFSCKKPFDSTTLKSLQYKWTVDSIVVFTNPQFNGTGSKIDGIQGYTDIRIDGKQYNYFSFNDAGTIHESYDTAYYVTKLDLKSIIIYPIINGNSNGPSDSVLVNSLTENRLVVSNTTRKQNGYTRYYFHRKYKIY